jgi:hypothetical protein
MDHAVARLTPPTPVQPSSPGVAPELPKHRCALPCSYAALHRVPAFPHRRGPRLRRRATRRGEVAFHLGRGGGGGSGARGSAGGHPCGGASLSTRRSFLPRRCTAPSIPSLAPSSRTR